jgi:hypothetical protein
MSRATTRPGSPRHATRAGGALARSDMSDRPSPASSARLRAAPPGACSHAHSDMSRSTCSIRHVLAAILLLAACTAPPRPVQDLPAPTPAPPVQVRVGTTVPGYGALELDAAVTRPLEAALAGVPDVTELYARTGPDRVDLVAARAVGLASPRSPSAAPPASSSTST